MNLQEKVFNYPTKYKEGFTHKEIEALLEEFPGVHRDKFDDALCGITCLIREEGFVIYHCDILSALRCGLENRDLKLEEWD